MPGFKDILGHDSIKEHLKKAAQTGMVSHAYILNGEVGMGRKSLARAFALALLCQEDTGEGCMVCHGCKQVLSDNHPDLIFVTHEKPSSIGVDDIRKQIYDTIWIKPYNSSYKIYIVDEAEMMTVQAQNALLKTIEEPPPYAVLLLLTTSQEAFLPTILSRCIQLKLKPLRDEMVRDYLMEKGQTDKSDAEIYVAFARGNLGRAISIADSEDFRVMNEEILKMLKNIHRMDISEILDFIRMLKEDKVDIEECLDFIQMWYRDVLLYKVTKDEKILIFKNECNSISEISDHSPYDGLEMILDSIGKTRRRLHSNVNMELIMELMLLSMKDSGINKNFSEKGV